MSAALKILEQFLLDLGLRMLESIGHNPTADQREKLRFEAKKGAQRLLLEHEGDLALALKHAAQQKLGGH